jgi:hypothetical protein
MKRMLAMLMACAGLAHGGYEIEVGCDPQYAEDPLVSLRMFQGGAIDVIAEARNNDALNTNIAGHTATMRIGTSATAASFITATSTLTTASTAQFKIPISAQQSNTNGVFWYTIQFYNASQAGPYYAGTGTCTIVETTASGATSAPSLLVPLNLDGYSISGTLPTSNLPAAALNVGTVTNATLTESTSNAVSVSGGVIALTVKTNYTGSGGTATNVSLASLTDTMSNNFFVAGDGTNLTLRSPAAARTAMGLGTAAVTNATAFATAAQGIAAMNAQGRVADVEGIIAANSNEWAQGGGTTNHAALGNLGWEQSGHTTPALGVRHVAGFNNGVAEYRPASDFVLATESNALRVA